MSKERQPKRESLSEKAKKAFWWVVKVGIVAGVSVAALKAVLL